MKFSMHAGELAKALYRVQGLADKKSTMPILAHVLLEASAEGLRVSATDLDVGLSGLYDAEVSEHGRTTVSAKQFYEVIRSLPSGRVDVCTAEEGWCEVEAGQSHFRLVTLSADEFPSLPAQDEVQFVTLPAKDLLQMIDRTLFCVSTDENRHNLSGIFCESPKPHVLRMVATDGHRLALAENHFEANLEIPAGAIVPRKGFLELKRVLSDPAANAQVEIGFTQTSGVLSCGKVTVYTRLIEGQFPDYQQVIPTDGTKHAEIQRSALSEALKRVSLLSQGRAHGVRFIFSEDTLELVAEDPDMGEAREKLQIRYQGEALTIGFNARYVLDVMALTHEKEIGLHLSDNLSPGVIRPLDDARFVAVVMPMRI